MSTPPLFEWDITVLRRNTYGDRVESRTPAKILAATKSEVTTKVRAAFDATYDDFRKFWSHSWQLNSVREVLPSTTVSGSLDEPAAGPTA